MECCIFILLPQNSIEDAGSLSFWMANASELLHFLKHDVELCVPSGSGNMNAQDLLAEAVQLAFRYLVICMQQQLTINMPAMLVNNDNDLEEENGSYHKCKLFHQLHNNMMRNDFEDFGDIYSDYAPYFSDAMKYNGQQPSISK